MKQIEIKEIDLFGMTEHQCVYRYLLAAMYNEPQEEDSDNQDMFVMFSRLMRTIRVIEGVRNNDAEKYYDGLQELSSMCDVLNFSKDFNDFIDKYFSDYRHVKLVNVDYVLIDCINRDLTYLGITYAN